LINKSWKQNFRNAIYNTIHAQLFLHKIFLDVEFLFYVLEINNKRIKNFRKIYLKDIFSEVKNPTPLFAKHVSLLLSRGIIRAHREICNAYATETPTMNADTGKSAINSRAGCPVSALRRCRTIAAKSHILSVTISYQNTKIKYWMLCLKIPSAHS